MPIISEFPTGGGTGKSIKNAVVTLAPSSFVYDGNEKIQDITSVVVNGVTLTKGTDYVVIGDTATDAGTHTLTVIGLPDRYTGAVTADWSISKASLTKPTISSGSFTYEPNTARTPTTDGNYSSATMSKSGDTSATDAGDYTLVVSLQDTDNYQWSGGGTSPLELAWKINKAQGSVSVNPTTLSIQGLNNTGTATITKPGDGSVSVKTSSSSIATASISGTTVTVTAKGAGTATITVTLAEGNNYLGATCTISVTVKTVTIYGASWDGTSTTKWTRTDASASFTDPVPYVKNATSYSSPFDNLLPWSGMTKVEDSEAGTMVAIPKFWYKITQSGSGMKIQIADAESDGFSVSPLHMNRGDGKGERDIAYIARYHAGATAYKSVSGQKPKVSITRSAARTAIHNLGSTIWQMDWAARFTLFLLYIVEFADWNSQAKIGQGCSQTSSSSSAVFNMGYTDSMPYHTGTTQTSRTSYGGTQYRWIEGLWDNCLDWIDGCVNTSGGLKLILNPSSFSDSNTGTAVGTPSSGYPSAFSVKNVSGTFPLFIPSAASGSTSTYSCDSWGFDSSNPCVCAGGNYYQSLGRGLFCWNYNSASHSGDYIGSRSMKLP